MTRVPDLAWAVVSASVSSAFNNVTEAATFSSAATAASLRCRRPPATSTTIKQSTKQRSLSQVLQQLTYLLPPCCPLKLHSRWLIRLMLARHLLALHPRFRNKALTCNSVLPVESDTFNLTDFRPPSLLHTLLAVCT